MSLSEKIRGEFIDIIEWKDDTQDTLVWRFPRYQDEIKNGAQLIVRPGQTAVFVSEGKIADVFNPGTHTLVTANLPVLSTLRGWKYGFDSPFKAEVYYVSTKLFPNLKWGTANPVLMRDPELGNVRVKAYGTYVLRACEPRKVVELLAGTNARFRLDEIHEQLRSVILSAFADLLGSSGMAAADLASHYEDFSQHLTQSANSAFSEMGLESTRVVIESITLPEEVTQALDRRAAMQALGDLSAYSRYQTAQAVENAAANPGGPGPIIGLGMGMAFSGQIQQSMSVPPPPDPPAAEWWIALNGQKNGPHHLDYLRTLITQGTLRAQTLVWKPGLAQWAKAETFAELRDLLSQAPPPMP